MHEEITTVEQYIQLIEETRQFYFEYVYFIDFRSSVEYSKSRIIHFKKNIDLTKESGESNLLSYIENIKFNSYIIVISETNDTLSENGVKLLKENNYTNIKHISIGFSAFNDLLVEKGLESDYIAGINCSC